MIPAEFEYDRPATVAEALAILARNPGSAKVLAGGQSLLGLMRLRLARPERLVDIGRLDELKGIRALPDGGLAIGALATYREVLDSALATSRVPLLAMTIADIGDVQVRNRGTVVGSIAHADPASDMPAVVLALEAAIVARSSSGERIVPATSFFEGAFVTDLAEDELLTEIRIPAQPAGVGMAYRRFEQPASGYSIAGAAAVVGRTGGVVIDGPDRGDRGRRRRLPGVGRRGCPEWHERGCRVDRSRRGPCRRRGDSRLRYPRRRRVPGGDGPGPRPAGDRGGAGRRRLTVEAGCGSNGSFPETLRQRTSTERSSSVTSWSTASAGRRVGG